MSWSNPVIALAGLLLAPPAQDISARTVEQAIQTLASPAFEGRLTLSSGATKAEQYLAGQFKRFGLVPSGTNGYLWPYETSVNQQPTSRNVLSIEMGEGRRLALTVGKDFLPLFGSKPFQVASGEMVWCGYGRESDYEGLDVKDKVVLAFRGAVKDGEMSTSEKARIAAKHGAKGVLFVGPAKDDGLDLARITRTQGLPPDVDLVGASISQRFFTQLTGLDFRRARRNEAFQSKALGHRVRMITESEPRKGMAHNVIGILPGNDPALRDELIVIGAHFDHLGYGEVGSRTGHETIHFGADDNASGTAGVLALAEAFAKERKNRRTIMFQLYSGEEEGLLGSAAWIKANPQALKQIHLMVNMDMIGRLRNEKVEVGGLDTSPDLPSIMKDVAVPGLTLSLSGKVQPNSDQASFARAQVPVVFWFTGLHDEYHTERDTPKTINVPGEVLVLKAVAQTINLADRRSKRLELGKFELGGREGGDPNPTRRVRVGFIPDMGDTGPGVLLGGASPDSPAGKAGIKAGDRLLEFDGMKINSVEDLQKALVQAKPNVTVKIKIRRDGKELELELTPVPAVAQ